MNTAWPIQPWAGTILLQAAGDDDSLLVSFELFESLDKRGLWRTLCDECDLSLSVESTVRVPPDRCEKIARVVALGNKAWPGDPAPEVLPFVRAFQALAEKARKQNKFMIFRGQDARNRKP